MTEILLSAIVRKTLAFNSKTADTLKNTGKPRFVVHFFINRRGFKQRYILKVVNKFNLKMKTKDTLGNPESIPKD